ncbi:MAG: DEAD/DEAH box helicase [Chlorobium sp.]|nr:DEAD/DEAH box helicase [Chlorobium sp.]
MTDPAFFSSIAEHLNRGATRAALGLLGFRSDALREHLRSLFQNLPGQEHSFLADLVFEATFGWKSAKYTMQELAAKKILHPQLVKALAEPPKKLAEEYTFPASRHPYQHQLQAWEALVKQPPHSVLVTSGTGSGKTECFLVPILNDLAKEIEEHPGPLVGVRALFLYPLNALIKSQKDRLAAWSEPFGGQIRYCLYNGDTPQNPPKGAITQDWKSEVADRKTLRKTPPPILVTNATMLEYMLVRADDRPILEQSQGKLRWIVIDEAHSYIGSQAAELTLLLRRVLHAFGCRPEDVHFIATSATIAGNGSKTKEQLQNFLADIAGVNAGRVSVIEGTRLMPELPPVKKTMPGVPSIDELRESSLEERFKTLAGYRIIREMRADLACKAQTLSAIATKLHGTANQETIPATLALLDICTKSKSIKKEDFLPLRGHFFQRTLSGLWACANPTCTGRTETNLDSTAWPFGKLFLERRTSCDACQFPVYELVQCGECGAEYLSVLELSKDGHDRLNPNIFEQNEDEFQQDLEANDADGDENEIEQQNDHGPGLPRLLVANPHGNTVGLLQDGILDWDRKTGHTVNLLIPDNSQTESNLRCPCCQKSDRNDRLFRPIRLGAPFLLQTAIPVLLQHLPPMQTKEAVPIEGRRLLSFTDSRQGTARIAVKLQIETERNYVRSFLYHKIADQAQAQILPRGAEQLRQNIAALEEAVKATPMLQNMLDQARQDLADLAFLPLGRLSWGEARNKLLADIGFKTWLLPPLREQCSVDLQEGDLAALCLWREFYSRPKRQFSMEGLGLLRLGYPVIEQITQVPSVAARLHITVEEWRALAQTAIDFIIRRNRSVEIPTNILPWLGYPGRPSLTLAPGQEKFLVYQKEWPKVSAVQGRRVQLIRLLCYALGKNIENEEDQELINEVLIALWQNIQPLMGKSELGYKLDMERVEIMQVRDAWLCPVTRRVLPVAFKGITPYLPEHPSKELAECRKITLPTLPHPFWLNESPQAADKWLESDEKIKELRALGLWSDLNDRIASFSRYFRSAEHSAQIPGSLLTKREGEFKSGKINLLSCSTTMEMGVDIGGLSAVAMHNAPPSPANFLQRAGRAGRRGESTALSFTLCKSSPHGEAVFSNPLWPFTTNLAVPRVSLHSEPIIQRHINAMVLATFLAGFTENISRLTMGWFFEPPVEGVQSTPYEKFRDWCERVAPSDLHLQQGIQTLILRSVLQGHDLKQLLTSTLEKIDGCANGWLAEVSALLDNLEIVKTAKGDSKAEKAVNMQLERFREEYLLSELTTRGFLPGYGFPGGVVPLVTTTAEDLFGKKSFKGEDDKKYAMRAGYPSRNRAVAIRDYAPGTDTVLNGRVYRSEGVTLNWHIPAEQEGNPELQSFRWLWRCKTCGENGTSITQPSACSECGEQQTDKLTRLEFLEPAGFAVDIRYTPHNDINAPQYIPVRDPIISMTGTDWVALPDPSFGRYRVSSEASIVHRTDGLHGNGYALCLRCGRADSMTSGNELPSVFFNHAQGITNPHKRLRGGKNNDQEPHCPGSDESWAIKRNLRLAAESHTEILELQLRDREGRPIDEACAYTIGIALRRALAEHLGVEEREIGVTTGPRLGADKSPIRALYLFDTATGGAGFVSQATQILPELFCEGKKMLACPKECDKACQACLLSHDTQHHLDDLDRKKALELLDDRFLHALELPEKLQVFGLDTKLEMEPLLLALRRERQRIGIKEVRIFLGGASADWTPLEWRIRDELMALQMVGVKTTFIVPKTILDALESSKCDEIAILATLVNADIYSPKELPVVSSGKSERLPRILEIGNETESIAWAVSTVSALAPSLSWGTSQAGEQFVRMSAKNGLSSIPSQWLPRSIVELRDKGANAYKVDIAKQFSGSIRDFGINAWVHLGKYSPDLKKKLIAEQPLQSIHYNDCFLGSPLSLILLKELLYALTAYPGGAISKTFLTITTQALEEKATFHPFPAFHTDWPDSVTRQEVFKGILQPIWHDFTFEEKWKDAVGHARVLRLTWSDGATCSIMLDHGFGHWQTAGKQIFPFDQSVQKQLEHIKDIDFLVTTKPDKKTVWHIGKIEKI